jgi:hypothetical protein
MFGPGSGIKHPGSATLVKDNTSSVAEPDVMELTHTVPVFRNISCCNIYFSNYFLKKKFDEKHRYFFN